MRDHLPTARAALAALAIAWAACGCQPSAETPGDDDSADGEQHWSWGTGGGGAGDALYFPEGDDPPFLVHAPPDYAPWVGWPVVMFLHDGPSAGVLTGDGWSEDFRGDWSALAKAEGFLLVVPGVRWEGQASSHEWAPEGTDGELVRLLTIVQQWYNVDLDHVHLVGHGRGGHAAERLGFTGSTKLASVGVHGAGLQADWAAYPEPPPSRRLPFLVTHDPLDQVFPHEASLNLFLTLDANGHEAEFRDELMAGNPPDPQHHRITPQVAAMHWDFGKAHPWAP